MKNGSLYSFHIDGRFARALDTIPCEIHDSFRRLAEARREAFESMYLAPPRRGGLVPFLANYESSRVQALMDAVTGDASREAFVAYQETGDESKIRALFFDRLLGSPTPGAEGDD
jgi:hypothetical protein